MTMHFDERTAALVDWNGEILPFGQNDNVLLGEIHSNSTNLSVMLNEVSLPR